MFGKKAKLSTESYKGVRDFYPEDMHVEKYLFDVMRKTTESFGYVEYGASILEPAELYKAKSGEEIVNDQTYTFTDRGNREVTLRPEMTPTVARMVAGRLRELSFPLRWYSIPNLFRYEQPQRGRLREHFQLNVDVFGIETSDADVEIISLAYQLLKNFGAQDTDFEIRINDRKLVDAFYESFKISDENKQKLSKLIDKKDKISGDAFTSAVQELLGEKTQKFVEALQTGHNFIKVLGDTHTAVTALTYLIEALAIVGIKNVVFTPTLMRGFDYYTGMVFEIFDTNPENRRSLFGGGRYDDLLSIFGSQKMSAVGFGAGDVTLRDFLETHKLLPTYTSITNLTVCVMNETHDFANVVAQKLRDNGLNVSVDYTDRDAGDKIKKALKDSVHYITFIGDEEVKSNTIKIKNLETRTEHSYTLSQDEKDFGQIAQDILNRKI